MNRIFIPEGEKDVNTLIKKGYAAFSCGGANDWIRMYQNFAMVLKLLFWLIMMIRGRNWQLLFIEKRFKGISKSVKIIVPMPDTPKADITDYFDVRHTVEEFEKFDENSWWHSEYLYRRSVK